MNEAEPLPDDPALLQAMVLGLKAQVAGMAAAHRAYDALVQGLRITIARLKKQRFGRSSEKIERDIEQLELALESLETARAAAIRRRVQQRAKGSLKRWPTRPRKRPLDPRRFWRNGAVAGRRLRRMRHGRVSCLILERAVRIVAAGCGWLARTSRKSSTSLRQS